MRDDRKEKVKQVWLGIFFLILFLLLWVHQTVQTTQISYKIQKLEEELQKEETKQIEFKMQADQYQTLEFVESVAKKKLGLIQPKENNIIVITLPES